MNEQQLTDDAKKVLAWSQAHTTATAAILGALGGFLVGLILGGVL